MQDLAQHYESTCRFWFHAEAHGAESALNQIWIRSHVYLYLCLFIHQLAVYPCAHGCVSTCTCPCIHIHVTLYPKMVMYQCGHVFMCNGPAFICRIWFHTVVQDPEFVFACYVLWDIVQNLVNCFRPPYIHRPRRWITLTSLKSLPHPFQEWWGENAVHV